MDWIWSLEVPPSVFAGVIAVAAAFVFVIDFWGDE